MVGRICRWLAGAILLAALVSGCGGDDATTSSLSKEQFVRKADAICNKLNDRYAARYEAFAKRKKIATTADEEEAITKVAVPTIRVTVEELSDLGVPSGDEEEVESITRGMEEALDQAEADPRAIVEGENPFQAVDKRATAYGLKVCGGL